MWRRDPDRRQVIEEYKRAQRDLNAYVEGLPPEAEEDERFLELNRRVAEAERRVPWWRRWPVS